jgi:hypothetical protein
MLKPTISHTKEYIQIDDDEIEDDYVEKHHVDDPDNPSYMQDYKLKSLNKYFRPYFSPYTDSYEMDYMKVTVDDEPTIKYLFVININTKYLQVEPVYNNISILETCRALYKISERLKPHTINNLRADADTGYGMTRTQSNTDITQYTIHPDPKQLLINYREMDQLHRESFERFCRSLNIKKLYITKERYLNRNRVVDRAIRTIRDMIGQRIDQFLDEDYIQHIVQIYNNKPHAAFNNLYSPQEVQNNPRIEYIYIQHQQDRLKLAKQQQAKFLRYKQGNILNVHIPQSKLHKHRRNFNAIVAFVDYVHGNVLVIPLKSTTRKLVTPFGILEAEVTYERAIKEYNQTQINPKGSFELPIYHTKKIADDYQQIPKAYMRELYTDDIEFTE